MKNLKIKKINFIPGLGEKLKDYGVLSKYLNIVDVDWNDGKIKIGKVDILAGFSMGAVLACEYSIKHKLKILILCSTTPGAETLKKVKADKVIFMAGEKEKWLIKDIKRISKTLPKKTIREIIIIPKADHKITGNYLKELLSTLKEC